MESFENSEKLKKYTNNKLTIEDFTIIKVVGKGSYGKVLLVKKNNEETIYAMKIMKKISMVKKNQVDHIKTERRILELIDHPFINKLKYAFQTEQKLYLVTDYCPGGELFFHIQRVERFNEEAAKFYAGQIILAVEHLHKNNIIYRDLKPENVLIDRKGFIKITDFGLSKENIVDNKSAKSFCGTPEYLAPEIILNKGHGKPVDWWSLGNLIYEMLTGIPPFYCKDRDILFDAITNDEPEYPEYLSDEVIDLIKKLLIKNPDKRLGNNGADEIKKHIFFEGMNWEKLLNKKIKPPFIPRLKNAVDTRYIDPLFAKATPQDTPVDTYESVDEDFNGFSFNK
jgi:protein-serine/threonine kinase